MTIPAAAMPTLKRKYRRVALKCTMVVEGEDEIYVVKAFDLSFGGAFIVTDTALALEAGQPVSLTLLSVGDGVGCCTQAQIARVTERGFAVQFIDPSPEFINAMVELIVPQLPLDALDGEAH